MSAEFFPEFIKALEKSEAGASLKETYRWSQFRTTESNETWRKYYGATGQVFTHGIIFFNDARWFLRREGGRFTGNEAEIFLLGIATHDIGEAKINGKGVGDIGSYIKTATDEKREEKIAHKVIRLLDLPQETKDSLLNGYKNVVEGENPKLNQAFKALETSEYVFTAIKVYLNNKRLRGIPALERVEAMVGRVLVYDLAKVLDLYAPLFPNSIGKFFHDNECLIDEMYAYSLPWLSTHTEWNGKNVDHKALAEAFKVKWEAFKTRKS